MGSVALLFLIRTTPSARLVGKSGEKLLVSTDSGESPASAAYLGNELLKIGVYCIMHYTRFYMYIKFKYGHLSKPLETFS